MKDPKQERLDEIDRLLDQGERIDELHVALGNVEHRQRVKSTIAPSLQCFVVAVILGFWLYLIYLSVSPLGA